MLLLECDLDCLFLFYFFYIEESLLACLASVQDWVSQDGARVTRPPQHRIAFKLAVMIPLART